MINKRTYLLIAMAFLAVVLRAQISPLADQYLINPFLTNPAFAGTSKKAPVSIAARQQWMGFTGAPVWQTATWHTSLHSKKQRFTPRGFVNKGENSFGNVGIGAGVFNIKYGAISQTGFHLNYAYHVYLGNGRLSFGLAPNYQQYVINKSEFTPPDGNVTDPLIEGDVKEIQHIIDVNAGVHFYSDKYFAGFSAVQLFNSAVSFGELRTTYVSELSENPWLAQSFYLYGGLTPALNRNVTLEPSAILKYNGQSGFRFQINMRAIIYQNFQAGLLYRFKESVGFFTGINIGDLIIRYQFEAPIGTAVPARFVTNQIMVGYLIM